MAVAFPFGGATHDKPSHWLTLYVDPETKTVRDFTMPPGQGVPPGGRGEACGDAYVESERDERIKTMLVNGYLELVSQPSLCPFEVSPEQVRCRITQKWLNEFLPWHNKMTVADGVEAAHVFIDKGIEALKELNKLNALR